MDILSKILGILKAWLYEILGVLLPGSVIVTLWPWPGIPAGPHLNAKEPIVFVGLAYIAGLACQGLGEIVTNRLVPPRPKDKKYSTCEKLKEKTVALIKSKYSNYELPDGALVGFCLSKVGANRDTYDKFLALRDMTRALMTISIPAGLFIVIHGWGSLNWKQVTAIIVGSALAAFVFYGRFRRYQPLAEQALYEQFIALELKPPEPKPSNKK